MWTKLILKNSHTRCVSMHWREKLFLNTVQIPSKTASPPLKVGGISRSALPSPDTGCPISASHLSPFTLLSTFSPTLIRNPFLSLTKRMLFYLHHLPLNSLISLKQIYQREHGCQGTLRGQLLQLIQDHSWPLITALLLAQFVMYLVQSCYYQVSPTWYQEWQSTRGLFSQMKYIKELTLKDSLPWHSTHLLWSDRELL